MIVPLEIPPGAFRNGTEYQAKGRWRDLNLVRWREGAMMPIGGWDAYTFPDATSSNFNGFPTTPRNAIAWLDNSNVRRVVWGSTSTVNVMANDGTVTDLTPAGYSPPGSPDRFIWQWAVFGEIPIGCQSHDGRILEWDLNTVNNFVPVTNSPTGCSGVLVTDERFIFALGAGGEPRRIEWCDRGDRTVWTPASTNQAGGYDLDTEGEILFGIQLRGETLIVTSKDCWTARYIGAPDVYEFNRVGSCTAVSGVCGARVDDRAFWMGERCFHVYVGGTVSQVPCEVADYIFADINDDGVINNPFKAKTFAWHHSEFNEVWWHYQSVAQTGNSSYTAWADCDKYVAYNYREGYWTYGSAPFSCVVDRVPFDQPLAFNSREAVFIAQHAYDSDPGYTLGTNWRIAGSVLDQSAPAASTAAFTVTGLIPGADYLLIVQISNRSAGTLTITFGSVKTTAANGLQFFQFAVVSASQALQFTGDGVWDGDITLMQLQRPIVFELETGFVHESSTPAPYAETGPLEIGDGERRVHVMRVIPDEQDGGELALTFAAREYPTSSEVTHGPYTAANPTDVRFSGRQFALKVAPGSNVDWRSGVHRLDIMPGGKR